MTDRRERIDQLVVSADRYDEFAETAELMGDQAGAERFRRLATRRRLHAMDLLDD
jgi:rubrerythrin